MAQQPHAVILMTLLIIIMADDKKIRESYYRRDKDFNEKIKEEMQE